MTFFYLDPGNSSIIAQIIGGLLGAFLLFFNQIKLFFSRKKNNNDSDQVNQE